MKRRAEMFAKTLDNSQHSMQLNIENCSCALKSVKFQVLTAASTMTSEMFNLVEVYRRFRGAPGRSIPEDSQIHKLKSHLFLFSS
jgi:hypothetical protein